jgi:hypothetical protein
MGDHGIKHRFHEHIITPDTPSPLSLRRAESVDAIMSPTSIFSRPLPWTGDDEQLSPYYHHPYDDELDWDSNTPIKPVLKARVAGPSDLTLPPPLNRHVKDNSSSMHQPPQ